MTVLSAGTYRLGRPFVVGANPGTYDAATPRLGRGVVQLVALLDLQPDEAPDPLWSRLTQRQPRKVDGSATLTLTVPGARADYGAGWLSWPAQLGREAAMGLLVAAVDRPTLLADPYPTGPASGDYRAPTALDTRPHTPWYGQPGDAGLSPGGFSGGLAAAAAPTILRDYWRPGPSLWSELSARGVASVDLRALAGGARYLAVALWGAWASTAYQATGQGLPVSWTVTDRRAPAPVPEVQAWPVAELAGLASITPGTVTGDALQARPDLYRVATLAPRGNGPLRWLVRHYGDATTQAIVVGWAPVFGGPSHTFNTVTVAPGASVTGYDAPCDALDLYAAAEAPSGSLTPTAVQSAAILITASRETAP